MARRPEGESSLFPFLSVLACVIGTLTLLIAALAMAQVAEDLLREDPPDPVEQAELARERADVRTLEEQLSEAARVTEQVAAASAELRALGIAPEATEAERRRKVDARLAAAQLARRLARLEREKQDVAAAIHGARTALVRERPRDGSPPIRILPQGSARPLLPFFVECREEGVRVFARDLDDSVYLARGSIEDVAAFRGFLQRVRSVRNSTVVFLIRPNGVPVYEWAVHMAGQNYVRHAKLPLPGEGELEFAL